MADASKEAMSGTKNYVKVVMSGKKNHVKEVVSGRKNYLKERQMTHPLQVG